MSRPDPNVLFDAKHRSVATILDFNTKRWRVPESDRDDLRQVALLQLWRSCVRACDPSVPPFTVSATIIALTVLRTWWRRRKRCPVPVDVKLLDSNPAPADELVVVDDGVRITLTGREARAEAGELLDLWNTGYDSREVAALLGCSKQRVHQLRHQLGGVWFPTSRKGRWRYPRDRIDAEAARRRRKAPRYQPGAVRCLAPP